MNIASSAYPLHRVIFNILSLHGGTCLHTPTHKLCKPPLCAYDMPFPTTLLSTDNLLWMMTKTHILVCQYNDNASLSILVLREGLFQGASAEAPWNLTFRRPGWQSATTGTPLFASFSFYIVSLSFVLGRSRANTLCIYPNTVTT